MTFFSVDVAVRIDVGHEHQLLTPGETAHEELPTAYFNHTATQVG
ncbi:MAG: hypothetical protein ACYC9L_09675 [Sulfuricaulis sp.]